MDTTFFSNKMIISSGLNTDSFGKTRMNNLLNQSGLLAKIDSDSIEFSDWKFSGTKNDENNLVWFCGDIFEGTKLSEIFEKNEFDENDKKKILTVQKVLTKYIENFPQEKATEDFEIGGGGIFISDDLQFVLFLPSSIFEQSVINSDKKNYAKLQGFYNYKGLFGIEQLLFKRAVISYKTLTKKFPYSTEDLSERQTDIFDKNFTPLSYVINGIDSNLANSIDAGLSISIQFSFSGEKRYKNPKNDLIRAEIIKLANQFSIEKFEEELYKTERKPELETLEFENRTSKFKESQRKKIKFARFSRRNKNKIITTAVLVVLAIWGTKSYLDTNGKLATSISLDSTQTTQAFYSLTHTSNVTGLSEIAKGKKMKDFEQIITGFYVTNKERESYNGNDRTVTPEQWFFYKTSTNYWLYGITNLKIDENEFEANCEIPIKNEKRQPITSENGIELKKGDRKEHLAQYYFIHTDTARINIEKITEKVTLQWNGNRWIVVELENIDKKSKSTYVKINSFKEEYQKALDSNSGSVKKAILELRKKYDWLPSDQDFKRGAEYLFENFKSTTAEKYLSE